MVLFDIPFSALGAGLISRRAGADRPLPALTWSCLGLGAPALAFLEAWTAWDWQYVIDPALLPPGHSGVFLILLMAAAWFGHYAGSQKPRLLIIPVVLLIGWNATKLDELLHVGTYAEYTASAAPILPMDFLMFLGAWGGWAVLVFVACWVWAGRAPGAVPAAEQSPAEA